MSEFDNNNSSISEKKNVLETRKIELEIKELEMKWWQKPSYLSIVITALIASISLFLGFYTGLIDKVKKEQREKIDKLEVQIQYLNSIRNSLDKKIIKLIYSVKATTIINEKLLVEEKISNELLKNQKSQINKLIKQIGK